MYKLVIKCWFGSAVNKDGCGYHIEEETTKGNEKSVFFIACVRFFWSHTSKHNVTVLSPSKEKVFGHIVLQSSHGLSQPRYSKYQIFLHNCTFSAVVVKAHGEQVADINVSVVSVSVSRVHLELWLECRKPPVARLKLFFLFSFCSVTHVCVLWPPHKPVLAVTPFPNDWCGLEPLM